MARAARVAPADWKRENANVYPPDSLLATPASPPVESETTRDPQGVPRRDHHSRARKPTFGFGRRMNRPDHGHADGPVNEYGNPVNAATAAEMSAKLTPVAGLGTLG